MTTRFSFSGAHAWASGPKGPLGAVEKLGILQRVQARWHAWRGTREQERLRKRLAETRLSGRKPVVQQSFGNSGQSNENSRTIELDDESDVFKSKQEERDEDRKDRDKTHKAPIFVVDREPEKPSAKKLRSPRLPAAPPITNYLPCLCCAKASAARNSMKPN